MTFPTAEIQVAPAMTPRQMMRGHTDWVRAVVHLLDGCRIITCSNDGSLRLWDLETGAQIGEDWRDDGDTAGVIIIALSQNGNTVASGSGDGIVRLWNVEAGNVIARWRGHAENTNVWSVCWSADDKRVASGSWDGTVRVWDVKSGRTILGPIETKHRFVLTVVYSPDSTKIATGGYDEHAVKVWNANTGKLLSTVRQKRSVWSLAWTSDGKKLVSGLAYDGSIRILDTNTWQQIAVLEGHQDTVRAVTLFRNDCLLASASWDKTVRLCNLDTNLPVCRPLDHNRDVNCAAFSANGKLLVSCCDDRNAYVWDIRAILSEVGLEHLSSIPDADTTQRLAKLEGTQRLPGAFFDDTPGRVHPSMTHRHPHPFVHHNGSALASSIELRPRPLLAHISSLFRRSRPSEQKEIELPRQGRQEPSVVEVATGQDRRSIYVSPPRKKTSATEGVPQNQSQASSPPQALVTASTFTTAATARPAGDIPSHPVAIVKNPSWFIRIVLFIFCASVKYTD